MQQDKCSPMCNVQLHTNSVVFLCFLERTFSLAPSQFLSLSLVATITLHSIEPDSHKIIEYYAIFLHLASAKVITKNQKP